MSSGREMPAAHIPELIATAHDGADATAAADSRALASLLNSEADLASLMLAEQKASISQTVERTQDLLTSFDDLLAACAKLAKKIPAQAAKPPEPEPKPEPEPAPSPPVTVPDTPRPPTEDKPPVTRTASRRMSTISFGLCETPAQVVSGRESCASSYSLGSPRQSISSLCPHSPMPPNHRSSHASVGSDCPGSPGCSSYRRVASRRASLLCNTLSAVANQELALIDDDDGFDDHGYPVSPTSARAQDLRCKSFGPRSAVAALAQEARQLNARRSFDHAALNTAGAHAPVQRGVSFNYGALKPSPIPSPRTSMDLADHYGSETAAVHQTGTRSVARSATFNCGKRGGTPLSPAATSNAHLGLDVATAERRRSLLATTSQRRCSVDLSRMGKQASFTSAHGGVSEGPLSTLE